MIIYLDQNKWIDLARAIINPIENNNFVDVANLIQEKSASGEWIFPLSMIHFFETCKRANKGSRGRLAGVMSKIAKNYAIKPFMEIEPIEFMKSYAKIHRPDITIEIKAIENNLLQAIGISGVNLEIKNELPNSILNQLNNVFEEMLKDETLFEQLVNIWDDSEFTNAMNIEDLESKKEWEALQIRLVNEDPQYRYKIFLVDSYISKFMRYAKSLQKIFNKSREEIMPVEHMCDEKTLLLLEDIPTLNVRTRLIYESLKNPQRPVGVNDSKDIAFLCTAIPYTDIIITEKTWCHFAKQARFDVKYSHKIESNLNILKSV